ncbi:hypothetical protein EXIGLDRAFT_835041 [Exidia glandulosa HHB12029]|uniref:Uncharacterized protein n=1 Tax=Exidia glandulosa HHB12029 TaxID=1314781 RepID=A0A165J517_EXIGL|nr:hypothetical protein EXIGLDRAFT_835041 [Exidia glandulosa HHB12029]
MSLNDDVLPPYETTPSPDRLEEIQIVAVTGNELLDDARREAQALVEKAKTMLHHKTGCRALADRADAIIFTVVVSTLCRQIVSDVVLAHVKDLKRLIVEADALFDEIKRTGPAMRNMNRSWTERRLLLLSQRLGAIGNTLQIRNGRCGLIEELAGSPPSPATSRLSMSSNPWSSVEYYPWVDSRQLSWRPSLAEARH